MRLSRVRYAGVPRAARLAGMAARSPNTGRHIWREAAWAPRGTSSRGRAPTTRSWPARGRPASGDGACVSVQARTVLRCRRAGNLHHREGAEGLRVPAVPAHAVL